MLVWLMVVAADTIGGEAIVQTCTTERSVGDVEKGSLVRESKPGRVRTKCRNSDSDFVSIGDGDSNPWMH